MLIHFSRLAQTILNQETRYQVNKKIIQDIFKTPSVTFKDTIQFRLTVIDIVLAQKEMESIFVCKRKELFPNTSLLFIRLLSSIPKTNYFNKLVFKILSTEIRTR